MMRLFQVEQFTRICLAGTDTITLHANTMGIQPSFTIEKATEDQYE